VDYLTLNTNILHSLTNVRSMLLVIRLNSYTWLSDSYEFQNMNRKCILKSWRNKKPWNRLLRLHKAKQRTPSILSACDHHISPFRPSVSFPLIRPFGHFPQHINIQRKQWRTRGNEKRVVSYTGSAIRSRPFVDEYVIDSGIWNNTMTSLPSCPTSKTARDVCL
jgi:hypothetical protein